MSDTNQLGQEVSPYLQQHAGNPVHWRAWGKAALAEAATRNQPILLSIGYAACHWCHVMAHESFEHAETAAVMNRLFINIKVDREERPDIDHIYMSALHALGEQGGWPLTMFLSPNGDPFWGGTYFPPEPRWGRPSFRQVLEAVSAAFAAGDRAVTHNEAALRRALKKLGETIPGDGLDDKAVAAVSSALLNLTDPVQGGMRGAPKFPNPPIFRLLWQQFAATGQTAFADAVHLLLQRMSQGGIYDHLGGGYARYATDAEWLVPHFEKMLYDNAQLLELLALAHAAAPSPLYQARATETVEWLQRDMMTEGAFAASEDADSEGVEGKFYVWSEAEIDTALGDASPAFKTAYDVTAAGNWEEKTILRRIGAPGTTGEEAALAEARAKLLAIRATRVRPGRDDKILADWNGLAIAALCRAATVFGRPDWLDLAATVFDRVVAVLGTSDGRIDHAWRLGRTAAVGLLDDQAAMLRAALALHEASGDPARLTQAIALAEAAHAHFADTDGSFFTTAADAADVPTTRPRAAADNATPSGNGMMAEALARLHHLTGDPIWRARAQAVTQAFSGDRDRLGNMPTLLAAADFLENATTVVIAGDPASPLARELLATALASPDPATCVLRSAGSLPQSHPAYGKHQAVGEQAAAFVCRAGICGLPIVDVDRLFRSLGKKILGEGKPLPPDPQA